MAHRLRGKVAVITGAANGIGQGTALTFAKEGAVVIAADRDAAGLRVTADRSAKNGFQIDSFTSDLTSETGVVDLMDYVVKNHGGMDTLVTAAGFTQFAKIPDMSLEQWQKTLTGELNIVFLPVRAAWPHLIRRGGGSIVNFASVGAWGAAKNVGGIAHAAGKGGVLSMTRQMAYEGAPHNIRANTVSPGTIVTPASEIFFEKTPGMKESRIANTMLPRLGTPEDVAWAIVYLAADESSWVTGADIRIDGGATAW